MDPEDWPGILWQLEENQPHRDELGRKGKEAVSETLTPSAWPARLSRSMGSTYECSRFRTTRRIEFAGHRTWPASPLCDFFRFMEAAEVEFLRSRGLSVSLP